MNDFGLAMKPIKGFGGIYWITYTGRVWSKPRPKTKGGFIKEALTKNGYAFVCLYKDNKKYQKKIHHLVAEAFIGERTNGLVIHHKDGDKLNNNVSNLEYVSKQKNTQEYYKSIGKSTGEIPLMDIPIIIDRVNKGEQCVEIAKEYDVTRNDIAVLCKVVALTGEELTLKEKQDA